MLEPTRSICPLCKQLVDAQIVTVDNRVLMRKRCPEHGEFEALVFSDAALYAEVRRSTHAARRPLEFATDVKQGCPHDCGLCPDHRQHSCVGLIEINSACNLDCPLCCAGAGTHPPGGGFELTFEQVSAMLDRFVAAEGRPEVIQFSGGEPTLHPRLLDFVELAHDKGIEYVMINTNGIRIAHDDRFLVELSRLKPNIYLQFDGFDEATYRALRGRDDLLETKLHALDRLAEVDLRVVLVPAIEHGINVHEVGAIVEFGLRHPAVFGINFQTTYRVNRHPAADPLTRVTIPDVLKGVEAQTGGLLRLSDFVPVPCCSPTCHFVTYAILDGEAVTPIPRLIDVEPLLGTIENRAMPQLSDDLVRMLERLWSASAALDPALLAAGIRQALPERTDLKAGSAEESEFPAAGQVPEGGWTLDRCPACQAGLPLSAHAPRDVSRHVFMVSVRDFMDAWNFDIRDVMGCCVSVLIPDGRIIPFCAYISVGYAEQVRQGLVAA